MCLPVRRESKRFLLTVHWVSDSVVSTCAFPFGGNRNENIAIFVNFVTDTSTCAFPFGGNRNEYDCQFLRCDVVKVYMCLPVRREWKQKTTLLSIEHMSWRSLHVPSRSEGMETQNRTPFPLDGISVYMCLPVRREWKRVRCQQAPKLLYKSTHAFPFGGNGNGSTATSTSGEGSSLHVPSRSEGMETSPKMISERYSIVTSTCAFPFGGNGNGHLEFHLLCRHEICLHVPSRSEGIETMMSLRSPSRRFACSVSLHVPSRSEGIETTCYR